MSRNNLSDSLNARIDAHVAKIHNRAHHYVMRAFLANDDCTLSIDDIIRVFDSINQRSNTTPLREQNGRISGVISDCREYEAANIVSHAFNRQVTHYTLLNPNDFSNTGFSLAENHITNRGRFKQRLNRELYDAIKNERVKSEMIESEQIISETVSLAECESHIPRVDSYHELESHVPSIPRETIFSDENVFSDETPKIESETVSSEETSDSDVLQEFAIDASDAIERKTFKRRDSKRSKREDDTESSVAA